VGEHERAQKSIPNREMNGSATRHAPYVGPLIVASHNGFVAWVSIGDIYRSTTVSIHNILWIDRSSVGVRLTRATCLHILIVVIVNFFRYV
jgi:hypothetical protein